MEEQHLSEVLESIQQGEQTLKDLGIAPEKINDAYQILQSYMDAQNKVADARSSQFRDDAYELAFQIKAGNKVSEIAQYLRNFAEYVVEHTLELVEQYKSAAEIVDHIPEMTDTPAQKERDGER